MSRGVRLGAACIALLFLLVSSAQADPPRATAGAPADYTKLKGLSKPKYGSMITESFMLPMADGVEVYVETTRPKAPGRFPVIAELSPYHGTVYQRDGVRMLPEQGGLVDYFVPRGYGVLMLDLRGTGKSQGCLDHMGPKDRSDIKEVIEWVASRPWSNGRVGTIGHSYPGGGSVMALSEHPKGLATAVVSAGLGSMYHHQFQAGVPYLAQWLGPMEAYEELAINRHLPGGDNFGNDMQYFGCGMLQSSLTAGEPQLSGQYVQWHAERDFRKNATFNPIPVFVIHGVNDNAARIPGLDWFLRRNGRIRDGSGKLVQDKAWIGQWDHGVGCCPNRRGYQWTKALHAWFDRHLKDLDVDTGPPVELFLNDETEEQAVMGPQGEIVTARRFPGNPRMLTFYPDVDGDLSTFKPHTSATTSFFGNPLGVGGRNVTGGVTFRTEAFDHNVLFAGVPMLRLSAAVTAPRVHLIANVMDESPEGLWRRISQFAINPELRNGIATLSPVIPRQRYTMYPPGWAMAHDLKKGHRLVLRITTSDPDKIPLFSVDPKVTVYTGVPHTVLQLPVVDRPVLYRDSLSLKEPK